MNVLISGSSGLIGAAVSSRLRADAHTVLPLVRPPRIAGPGEVAWNPETGEMDIGKAAGAEGVVNLAGESIAGSRWSEARKALLRSSRVDTTRKLVDALAQLDPHPKVLVSASAVGYYGNRGNEVLTEDSTPGDDFLGRLVQDWETETRHAEQLGIRTVLFRFGIVLSAQGGALAQMLGPFRMGVGGRMGSGQQWMPWISLADAVRLIEEAVTNQGWSGAYNAVAPERIEERFRVVDDVRIGVPALRVARNGPGTGGIGCHKAADAWIVIPRIVIVIARFRIVLHARKFIFRLAGSALVDFLPVWIIIRIETNVAAGIGGHAHAPQNIGKQVMPVAGRVERLRMAHAFRDRRAFVACIEAC